MTRPACLCPLCSRSLKAPPPEALPAKVKCPGCGCKFLLNTAGAVERVVEGPVRPPMPPPAPVPAPELVFSDPPTSVPVPGRAHARAGSNTGLLIGVFVAGVLLVGGGVAVAVIAFSSPKEDPPKAANPPDPGSGTQVVQNPPVNPANPANPALVLLPEPDKKEPPKPVAQPVPQPVEKPKPKPPSEFALPEAQQKKVNDAVAKGVAYLKKCANDWNGQPTPYAASEPNLFLPVSYPGTTSLVGLTLLACGVPADDPAVKKCAETVRRIFPNWSSLADTYDLAAAIMFLDRLNGAGDKELIQKIALRLIAAQMANGSWNYTSPVITPQQATELMEALKQPGPPNFQTAPGLARYACLRVEPGKPIPLAQGGYQDNSLIQFGTLALWLAQKHGVPAERSLLLAAERFRSTQNEDGSWGYRPKASATPGWTFFDSMTCAGLISLAVARGAETTAANPRAFQKDPLIEKALIYVSTTLGKPRLPANAPVPTALWGTHRGRLIGANAWGDLYYLWTLERTAVIYNLKKINGREWYPWGADIITGSQQPDGSWKDRYHGAVDTCFALLFLKRVNIVQDLSEKLMKIESAVVEPEKEKEKIK